MRPRPLTPILCVLLCATFLLSAAHSTAQSVPDRLPPGVSIARLTALVPEGYSAEALLVDWSEPGLVAKLVKAPLPGRPAPDLTALEVADPQPLRIQLGEPLNPTEPDGGLALPLELPDDHSATPFAAGNFIALSPVAPWVPVPALTPDDPNLAILPLPPDSARIAARWLGRGNALDQLPSFDFDRACLLSLTQRTPAQTRFLIIHRTGSGRGRLGELRPWLKKTVAPNEFVAIHSVGPQSWIGLDGWRLGAPADPRYTQRAGAILELRRARKGDPVDWLRQPGVRLRSSTSEPDFTESAVIGNPLIPDPLSPRAWVSLPRDRDAEPPFYMVTFQTPRLVERIDIAFAEAAGWSHHFNPARVTLQVARENEGTPRRTFEFSNPPVHATWTPERPTRIRAIRLVFDETSHIPTDTRARLAALSVWGAME